MNKRLETRIVIVDENGIMYQRKNCLITESVQDNGKTVKFFITNGFEEEVE